MTDAPVPPWVAYPELHSVSIGWRMGSGEAHLIDWQNWAEGKTDKQLLSYFADHQPIPFYWADFVVRACGGPRLNEHDSAEQLSAKGLAVESSLDGAITESAKMIGDPGELNARRVRATASIEYPGAIEDCWDLVVNADLTKILTGTSLLPAVTNVFHFGHWGVAGLRRRLELSDGSFLNEIVIDATPPQRLGYRIYGITGKFGLLTNGADAEFVLRAHEEGTTLQWTYDYDSRSVLTYPLVSTIIKRFWEPYMASVLRGLSHLI